MILPLMGSIMAFCHWQRRTQAVHAVLHSMAPLALSCKHTGLHSCLIVARDLYGMECVVSFQMGRCKGFVPSKWFPVWTRGMQAKFLLQMRCCV